MAAEVIIFEDAKKKAFLQEAQIMKVTRAGFQSKMLEGRMVGFFMPLTVRSGKECSSVSASELRSSCWIALWHCGLKVWGLNL